MEAGLEVRRPLVIHLNRRDVGRGFAVAELQLDPPTDRHDCCRCNPDDVTPGGRGAGEQDDTLAGYRQEAAGRPRDVLKD